MKARKHVILVVSVLVLAALAGGLVHWVGPVVAEPEEMILPDVASPEGSAVARDLQQIRRELTLTDLDLAAMGCDGPAAREAIARLVTWYETNRAELDRLGQRQKATRKQLRLALREVATGRADGETRGSIPRLRSDLSGIVEQRRDLLAAARRDVEASLGWEQQASWERGRSGSGRGLLRYVSDVEPEQWRQIHIRRRAAARRAARGDRDDLPSPSELPEGILTYNQERQFLAAKANVGANLQAVRGAVAEVIPSMAEPLGNPEAE